MVKKKFILFLGIIIMFSFINAYDSEINVACGGDDELMFVCPIGDDQTGFFGNVPESEVITANLGNRQNTVAAFLAVQSGRQQVIMSSALVVIFFLLILLYLMLKKKKE